jgi:hypothetical protein
MDLDAQLLNLDGLTEAEIEAIGRTEYERLYILSGKFGVHRLHDDSEAIFWLDRFEHAFWTSPNRRRDPYSKTMLALERIARVRWIAAVMRGCVPESECWHVPGDGGRRHPPNRLYVLWPRKYIVWFEPRKNSGWKFSSAYTTSAPDIRRYCYGGRKIWTWGRDVPRD